MRARDIPDSGLRHAILDALLGLGHLDEDALRARLASIRDPNVGNPWEFENEWITEALGRLETVRFHEQAVVRGETKGPLPTWIAGDELLLVAQGEVVAGVDLGRLRPEDVQVRGDASGNVFEENHLRGNGYFFEAFEEPAGVWGYPHDNRVTGGLVENTRLCLRFAGAYDNTVEQLQLEQVCDPPAMWAVGGQEATGNTIDIIIVP